MDPSWSHGAKGTKQTETLQMLFGGSACTRDLQPRPAAPLRPERPQRPGAPPSPLRRLETARSSVSSSAASAEAPAVTGTRAGPALPLDQAPGRLTGGASAFPGKLDLPAPGVSLCPVWRLLLSLSQSTSIYGQPTLRHGRVKRGIAVDKTSSLPASLDGLTANPHAAERDSARGQEA